MKLLIITLTCLFSFSVFAKAKTKTKDPKPNILTIRSSTDKSKEYKITKITKSEQASGLGNVITIETDDNQSCIIPLNKIQQATFITSSECAGCMKSSEEVENYYSQLFLNASSFKISCDITNGEVTGFNFIGATKIEDKPIYTVAGIMFDSAVYADGVFTEIEKEPSKIEKFLDGVMKVIFKGLAPL